VCILIRSAIFHRYSATSHRKYKSQDILHSSQTILFTANLHWFKVNKLNKHYKKSKSLLSIADFITFKLRFITVNSDRTVRSGQLTWQWQLARLFQCVSLSHQALNISPQLSSLLKRILLPMNKLTCFVSQGRVRTTIRRGGQFCCSFLANLFQYLRDKTYQNIAQFDILTSICSKYGNGINDATFYTVFHSNCGSILLSSNFGPFLAFTSPISQWPLKIEAYKQRM